MTVRKEQQTIIGKRRAAFLAALLLVATIFFSACGVGELFEKELHRGDIALSEVPDYDGVPYVEVDGGKATFTEEELVPDAYESYSDLDDLGRCGTAEACLGEELMPTEERERISEVHPTGWQRDRYSFIEGENLYNRCHLIAYALTAENANEENLITGTRYMNYDGMKPFEDMTARYIDDTGNHVMYRVTPIFEGENLVASGVHMMAESIEDNGEGINFNIYCYNVQPGVDIDYATGVNALAQDSGAVKETVTQEAANNASVTYVLNESSGKFHKPTCPGVSDMNPAKKKEVTATRQELLDEGYEPCGTCNP